MSLKISRFMSKPHNYRSRKILRQDNVKLTNCSPTESGESSGHIFNFVVQSQSNILTNYNCDVFLKTDNLIHIDTECQLRCSCPSFMYEFSAILNHYKSLYGTPLTTVLPKKKRQIFTCKHILTCLSFLLQLGNVNNALNKFGGGNGKS